MARDLNQKAGDEAISEFDEAIAEERDKQNKAPWHREGATEPPVNRLRSAGAMTKGMRMRLSALPHVADNSRQALDYSFEIT